MDLNENDITSKSMKHLLIRSKATDKEIRNYESPYQQLGFEIL